MAWNFEPGTSPHNAWSWRKAMDWYWSQFNAATGGGSTSLRGEKALPASARAWPLSQA